MVSIIKFGFHYINGKKKPLDLMRLRCPSVSFVSGHNTGGPAYPHNSKLITIPKRFTNLDFRLKICQKFEK